MNRNHHPERQVRTFALVIVSVLTLLGQAPIRGADDCVPAPAGMVAWWQGEGNAQDATGQYPGVASPGVTYGFGKVGQAMVFDGNSASVMIPHQPALITPQYSVEVWVKPEAPVDDPSGQEVLFGQSYGRAILAVRQGANGLVPRWVFTPTGWVPFTEAVSSQEIPIGEFSHLVGTWDGSALRLYVNGTLAAETFATEGPPFDSGRPFEIGGFSPYAGYTGQFFKGVVDEATIYSRALSGTEVRALLQAGSAGKCAGPTCAPPAAGLVGWWRGEGNVTDQTGIGEGVALGGLAFEAGEVGTSFVFDGVDAMVAIPERPWSATGSLTIEGWIKPADVGQYGPLASFTSESGKMGVHLWHSVASSGLVPGNLYANLRDNSTTPDEWIQSDHIISTTGGVLVSGAWTHVALTYDHDSGVARLYVNGEQKAEENLGRFTPRTTHPLHLGGVPSGNTDGAAGIKYRGNIDELSVYEQALTPADVGAIYRAGANGKCLPQTCTQLPAGALAMWPAEDSAIDLVTGVAGTTTGAVGYGPGLVGRAFTFNGANGGVVVEQGQPGQLQSLTVEGWVKVTDVNIRGPLVSFCESNGKLGLHLWHGVAASGIGSSPGTVYANLRDTTRSASEWFQADHLITTHAGALQSGIWTHIALTYDQPSGSARIYVDGAVLAEANLGSFTPRTAHPVYLGTIPLGNEDGSAGVTLNGMEDEIAIYDRALTEAEIAAIVLAGSAGKCLPDHWNLAVETVGSGTVARDPDQAAYAPGTTVTLTATPAEGFAFAGWSGGLSGDANPKTFTMDHGYRVTATFRDAQAPEVVIRSPEPGPRESEVFTLSGTATDNVGVVTLRWYKNGEDQGPLHLASGGYFLRGQRIGAGDTLIKVVATDAAGNEGSAEVLVSWMPPRVLSLGTPPSVQEGLHVTVPVRLTSPGGVGGAGFVVRYDPVYLADPKLTWDGGVSLALSQVNYGTAGEVRATFSLPGTAIPAGTLTMARVVFRARSVPATLDTPIGLELVDMSAPSGLPIATGNAAFGTTLQIKVRRLTGDNNGNNRLDVGDASVMQRLLIGLETPRAWDHPANDLNASETLDSGDVIRVLRVVAGLDPRQVVVPLGALAAPAGAGREGRIAPLSMGAQVVLEASASQGAAGDLITVNVRLDGLETTVSGASFTLKYPVQALRLLNSASCTTGELVPAGGVVALWNVEPAGDDFTAQTGVVRAAVSGATAWPASSGVLAKFVFQVQAGQSDRYAWPLLIEDLELTSDGYQLLNLPPAQLRFVGREPIPARFGTPSLDPATGAFRGAVSGEPDVPYLIEVTSDFKHWDPVTTVSDPAGSLQFTDPAASGEAHRFYRATMQ